MGFSVTASHAIFMIALLTVGGIASANYWRVARDLDDSRRIQADRQDEIAHTNMTIVGTPDHNLTAQRYTVNVRNTGTTVLRLSELAYVVDGAYTTSVESLNITGASSTDLWLPGETLEIKLSPILTPPLRFALFAGNGVPVYYEV